MRAFISRKYQLRRHQNSAVPGADVADGLGQPQQAGAELAA
jgi:hypothetical protein